MLCREAVDKCLRLLSFYESLGRLIRKSQINCRVTLPSVFISYSCLNKVPQTRRLKTTKIYSLTVLEARSKNDGRAMFHLKPEEEILFSLLLASDSRRQSSHFIGFQMPHWSVCHCYLMAIIFLCVSLPSYGILSDSPQGERLDSGAVCGHALCFTHRCFKMGKRQRNAGDGLPENDSKGVRDFHR